MRLIRSGSCTAGVVLLLGGSAHITLAQAPGTGTDQYTVLFRAQGFMSDFVAVSVDGLRTLEDLQELVCHIATDYRINIGASLSLVLRICRDISEEEYVPAEYLRFLDEDAGVVFESQEEQTLVVYRWTGVTEATALANPAEREQTSSIELLMSGEGAPIRPPEFHEFDHTGQCGDP